MGTFILKRKYFADSEKKSDGWSTVGKIATGTAAALGTTALGLRMGRKGTFGTGIQNRVGNLYQNVGAKMANSGSRAIQGLGYGLGRQGTVAKAQASATNAVNRKMASLEKSGGLKGLTEQQINEKRSSLFNTNYGRTLKGQDNTFEAKIDAVRKNKTTKK